jgi:hypothetical protein
MQGASAVHAFLALTDAARSGSSSCRSSSRRCIEGEIIAARVQLGRARERMGDDPSDCARHSLNFVEDMVASLLADRDRLRAGKRFDEAEAQALLARCHRT